MWFFFLWFTLATSPILGDADWHKFHVSRCMAEYNEDEEALQMRLHIFLDDLEDALALGGADDLHLCTENERDDAEAYLGRYLRKQLSFTINGVPADFNFLGKEISDDYLAVWCYLEITDVPSLKKLTVNNAVLLDLYDDQKNIMHIIGPKRKQGTLLFRKGATSETVSF